MVVLSAIGRFFKKIWDWIKQTAWIQPLLIVGIIFGVIFSIPPIVKAIKNADEKRNGAEYYYQQFRKSLEGEKTSPADKLVYAIENLDTNAVKSQVGQDKFFLAFVEPDSTEWATYKEGFQEMEAILKSNSKKSTNDKDKNFISDDGNGFKLVTIFINQETKAAKDSNESAFETFLNNHDVFLTEAAAVAEESNYGSVHCSETQLENMIDGSGFTSTATLMLVDMTPAEEYTTYYNPGVNEVMFGVPAGISKPYELGKFLMECWNHTGDFSPNK